MVGIFRFAAFFFCLTFGSLLYAQTSGSVMTTPSSNLPSGSGGAAKQRPNILFIIIDDVGIDQMQIFATHKLDSQPMLPYLTNPHQPSILNTNFTQTASN